MKSKNSAILAILVLLASSLATGPASFAQVQPPASEQPPSSQQQSPAPAQSKTHSAPVPHKGWNFKTAGLIPVQSGGRVKPLDSWARDIVLFMVGTQSYQGWDPVDLAFSWISNPHPWVEMEFIKIGREDVRRQLHLDEKRILYSPGELMKNEVLAQYATRMAPPPPGMKVHPRDQELKRVVDRLGTFRAMASGEAWTVVPSVEAERWESLAADSASGNDVRAFFVEMVKSHKDANQAVFEQSSERAKSSVAGMMPGWSVSVERAITWETFYNRFKPFRWSWVFYLVSGLAFTLGLMGRNRKKGLIAAGHVLAVVGVLIHVGGMGLRVYIAGRPPVTNMYESIIWVSFGTMFFAWILFALHRQVTTLAVATIVAAFTLIAADSAPAIMDPSIQPLVPVLRSNYWLTIHVLTITLGYAAFALSLGLGNVTLYHFLRPQPDSTQVVASLNQLTYRATQFGVVLLAAGTILGGVWADESWGRFWGWDPKEVWALIALLCYLAILHGRYANWVGQFGFAAWSVIAFLSVLMAWYGVNFVLGQGLHSYGFASGGTGWVAAFCALQLAFVAICAVRAKGLQYRLLKP